MPAAATDKFKKGASLFSTTLSSSIGSGDTTIPLNSVTGLATDTAVTLTIDATNSAGVQTLSTREVVTGVVSGSSLVNVVRGKEGTAQSHASGAVVTEYFTKTHLNDLIDGILAGHQQDGDHKFTTVYDVNDNETLELGTVAAALNNIKLNNAATGNNPTIQASGQASRAVTILDSNGNEVIIQAVGSASAVNEITITNAGTGNPPIIAASGGDTNVGLRLTPKGTGNLDLYAKGSVIRELSEDGSTAVANSTIRALSMSDFVESGLNPSSATGLTVTIPAGVYWIGGKRYIYAGGTKVLGASKDAYLDIDTSGTITSVEVANNVTTGMTLTANSVRFAKIITGAASVTSYNTGTQLTQQNINASTNAFDYLGNRIRPTYPDEKLVGYNEAQSSMARAGSVVTVFTTIVNLPVARRIKISMQAITASVQVTAGTTATVTLWDGAVTSGTQIGGWQLQGGTSGGIQVPLFWQTILRNIPTAGAHTYSIGLQADSTGTATLTASATYPFQFFVEYV